MKRKKQNNVTSTFWLIKSDASRKALLKKSRKKEGKHFAFLSSLTIKTVMDMFS